MPDQDSDLQVERVSSARGRIMVMGSAYHVAAENRGRDVVVNASYSGVLPARFIAEHKPRGSIGVDCAIGPAGASIAGLWYLEALNIPAAAADVMTVKLGDGNDLYDNGVISFWNQPAADCGVVLGMSVAEAARLLLEREVGEPTPGEVTNRSVMLTSDNGRSIVCVDSIAFGAPEDKDTNVLVAAGHTGITAVPYLAAARPFGFIGSDGGGGRDDSGIAGIYAVEATGLPAATVDARTARMGDGRSTYHEGIISASNAQAERAGVQVGMRADEAALRLLRRNDAAENVG